MQVDDLSSVGKEVQSIEQKIAKLNAYYDEKVKEINEQLQEKLHALEKKWTGDIKQKEIETLKKGRAKIEKEAEKIIEHAKTKQARLIKKKIEKKSIERVLKVFIETVEKDEPA